MMTLVMGAPGGSGHMLSQPFRESWPRVFGAEINFTQEFNNHSIPRAPYSIHKSHISLARSMHL